MTVAAAVSTALLGDFTELQELTMWPTSIHRGGRPCWIGVAGDGSEREDGRGGSESADVEKWKVSLVSSEREKERGPCLSLGVSAISVVCLAAGTEKRGHTPGRRISLTRGTILR